MSRPLAPLFPAAFRTEDPALEASLQAFVGAARAAHRDFAVDDDRFFAFVAARLSQRESVRDELSLLHAEDLYLACACVSGDARAISVFDRRYLSSLGWAHASFRSLPHTLDDLRQMLRERLLVGTATEPPKLALYRGEGELGAWVRVAITRQLINMSKRPAQEVPSEDEVFSALTSGSVSPEIDVVRRTSACEVRDAFVEALGRLTVRQRNLLRYQFVEGLSGLEIATIYRTHRSTVVRWMAETKTALEWEMRSALERRVRVSGAELESLVRSAWSGLDITLSRYLDER